MQLNHLHLKSHDIAASRAFYERYFGFRFFAQHGDGAFLTDDANFLVAIFPYKADDTPLPEWFHFGFCVGSSDVVEKLYARMKKDNVPFSSELSTWGDGAVTFYCVDPGGNKVEVGYHPEEAHLYAKASATVS